MMKGLEPLTHGERLRAVAVQPGKESARVELVPVCKYLMKVVKTACSISPCLEEKEWTR